MKTFKYKVIYSSIWAAPEIYLVNTLEDVNLLKYHGREEQYLVEVVDTKME